MLGEINCFISAQSCLEALYCRGAGALGVDDGEAPLLRAFHASLIIGLSPAAGVTLVYASSYDEVA